MKCKCPRFDNEVFHHKYRFTHLGSGCLWLLPAAFKDAMELICFLGSTKGQRLGRSQG
jgi:hypothetical protein